VDLDGRLHTEMVYLSTVKNTMLMITVHTVRHQLEDMLMMCNEKKAKVSTALYRNPSQSYGASPTIWDHTVLPTCHLTQVNAPRLNPSHAGRYLNYLPRRNERLSWPWCWLYTETVYLPADSHQS